MHLRAYIGGQQLRHRKRWHGDRARSAGVHMLAVERLEPRRLLAVWELSDTLLSPQSGTQEGYSVAVGEMYYVTGKPFADFLNPNGGAAVGDPLSKSFDWTFSQVIDCDGPALLYGIEQ